MSPALSETTSPSLGASPAASRAPSSAASPAASSPAASCAAELAPSEYERRLEAAYAAYIARLASGEEVDEAAFCDAHAPVRSSLARLISAHRFLEHAPGLLSDGVGPQESQSQAPPDWPAPGQLFEGFRLLRELGRGAFARVYLARQPALGDRLVAVKITPGAQYEAAALGRIEHHNIVPIHSVHHVPARGLSVVCMPYRGRVTLHHVFDSMPITGPLPPAGALLDVCHDDLLPAPAGSRFPRRGAYADAVRTIALQVADGLAYLHERGTCHRDLKPSNVLLQPDGTPLLLDFNLSDNAESPNVFLGGTPAYMAPEQLHAMTELRPGPLDGKVDVFALGVILYQWLAGRLPFGPVRASLADAARLDLIARQRRGPLPLVREGLDASLARLIQRCLAFDAAQRPTARELTTELRRQLRPPRRLARAAARRPGALAATAAALLGVVLAATVYGVTRPAADVRAYQDGAAAYREGRFEEAEEHFNRAVRTRPSEAKYRYARARTWQQRGEHKKEFFSLAGTEYSAAEELQSDPRHAAGNAYCFQRLGRPDPARQLYERALAGGYASAGLLNNLACCCMVLNAPARAEEHLTRALELEPSLLQAHWNMAIAQKHLWARMPVKPENERAADPAFRRLLAVAKRHIHRAIELSQSPAAELFAEAAHVHALGVLVDPTDRDAALQAAQRAVDAGMAPTRVLQDSFLKAALDGHRDMAALQVRAPAPGASIPGAPSPGAPPAKLSRLIDPLPGI